MHSSCAGRHENIIAATCPWCKKPILHGQVVDELPSSPTTYDLAEAQRNIVSGLRDKLNKSMITDLKGEAIRRELRLVAERLCDTEYPLMTTKDRNQVVNAVLSEVFP